MRQIVLDTETTGLEPEQGHRVIEIGGVELDNRRHTRRNFHRYLNPQREIDQGALEVHGITSTFLADKPLFADVADEFLAFVEGAQLVIHNAPFDVAFLNAELARLPGGKTIESYCEVIDTLALARAAHPGQRNSLDALCARYEVDNSQRELHGALLDAEILADVYLAMTGGQADLALIAPVPRGTETDREWILPSDRPALRVVEPDSRELERHEARLNEIEQIAPAGCAWRAIE